MFHGQDISKLMVKYIVAHINGGNMNMCFLFGKINSEISFDFLINHKKHISIASCFILSEEGNEIKLFAFDKIADSLYSNFEDGYFIKLEGVITNDGVEVIRIYEY